VYYPSIDEDRMMTFREPRDLDSMTERGLGFREPEPDAPEATTLDAIVVPALAVDDRGYRLGYGAGYYDHTLPRFAPPARTIVVAFDYQFVIELPALPHDVACDVVVTDARLVRVKR
jgi:5-formyltetrahydrofolate cyclo-ligase